MLILVSGATKVISGNGYERNQNGPNGTTTSWAQPSGLALYSPLQNQGLPSLLVADSESSSIRLCNLESGAGNILAGGDPMFSDNLFRFGDKDGIGSAALFQHPLAVLSTHDGRIVVADSYNHKVKVRHVSC